MKNLISNLLNIAIFVVVFIFISIISITTIYPEINLPERLNLNIMALSCILTFTDFWIRFFQDNHKLIYTARNFIFLLASIPFLNISYYFGITLIPWQSILIHFLPLIRAGQSIMILGRWGITRKAENTFYSYLIGVLGFTYFSSLMFYQFEKGVNSEVTRFWDAIVWACSNLVTIGSDIQGTTEITQALSFILGACGMLLFPIFTAYLNTVFERNKNKEN